MKKSLIVLTSTLSLVTFSALAENPKQAKTEQQTKIEKISLKLFKIILIRVKNKVSNS